MKTILITGIGGLTPRSIATIIRKKHPDYKQDYLKEKILFAEFNKLLKQEKYLNLSLSELLEIAHTNIQQ